MDTSCLFTVVRNISGAPRYFGFLGPRGTELDDNEEFAVLGSLPDSVARGSFGDRGGAHWTDALLTALGDNADGDQSLEVVSTPAVTLYDATAGEIKQLLLDNETLGTTDPCWTSAVA
jgi:hypothetical protein